MADERLLLRVLSDFARTLVSDYAVGDVLHDLVDRVTEVLGVAGASVSLADGDRISFATAASEPILSVQRVQEDTQSGPCVDAHRSGELVLVTDLHDERRWPAFTKAALAVGVIAVAGIPMQLTGNGFGSLNLYATEQRDWSDEDLGVARVLADIATSYLANASELERARRITEQLQEALQSRAVIEQAKGMLAAQQGISVEDAFELLRRHARSHNASLRSVADAVVRLGLRP